MFSMVNNSSIHKTFINTCIHVSRSCSSMSTQKAVQMYQYKNRSLQKLFVFNIGLSHLQEGHKELAHPNEVYTGAGDEFGGGCWT